MSESIYLETLELACCDLLVSYPELTFERTSSLEHSSQTQRGLDSDFVADKLRHTRPSQDSPATVGFSAGSMERQISSPLMEEEKDRFNFYGCRSRKILNVTCLGRNPYI